MRQKVLRITYERTFLIREERALIPQPFYSSQTLSARMTISESREIGVSKRGMT